MKFKVSFFLFVCLMVLSMGSCKKATYLNANKTDISFSRTGGKETVSLDCDEPDYDFKSGPEWIKANIDGSKLTIEAPQNNSGAPRNGELVITSSGQQVVISLHQVCEATKLNVSESAVTLPKEGGTREVTIDTDGDVQVVAPDFVSANLENGKLVITASTNDGSVKKGDIKLTSGHFLGLIKVTQEGNVCPTCHGRGKIACPDCGGDGVWGDGRAADTYCARCGGYMGEYMFVPGTGRIKCPTCHGTGR